MAELARWARSGGRRPFSTATGVEYVPPVPCAVCRREATSLSMMATQPPSCGPPDADCLEADRVRCQAGVPSSLSRSCPRRIAVRASSIGLQNTKQGTRLSTKSRWGHHSRTCAARHRWRRPALPSHGGGTLSGGRHRFRASPAGRAG